MTGVGSAPAGPSLFSPALVASPVCSFGPLAPPAGRTSATRFTSVAKQSVAHGCGGGTSCRWLPRAESGRPLFRLQLSSHARGLRWSLTCRARPCELSGSHSPSARSPRPPQFSLTSPPACFAPRRPTTICTLRSPLSSLQRCNSAVSGPSLRPASSAHPQDRPLSHSTSLSVAPRSPSRIPTQRTTLRWPCLGVTSAGASARAPAPTLLGRPSSVRRLHSACTTISRPLAHVSLTVERVSPSCAVGRTIVKHLEHDRQRLADLVKSSSAVPPALTHATSVWAPKAFEEVAAVVSARSALPSLLDAGLTLRLLGRLPVSPAIRALCRRRTTSRRRPTRCPTPIPAATAFQTPAPACCRLPLSTFLRRVRAASGRQRQPTGAERARWEARSGSSR